MPCRRRGGLQWLARRCPFRRRSIVQPAVGRRLIGRDVVHAKGRRVRCARREDRLPVPRRCRPSQCVLHGRTVLAGVLHREHRGTVQCVRFKRADVPRPNAMLFSRRRTLQSRCGIRRWGGRRDVLLSLRSGRILARAAAFGRGRGFRAHVLAIDEPERPLRILLRSSRGLPDESAKLPGRRQWLRWRPREPSVRCVSHRLERTRHRPIRPLLPVRSRWRHSVLLAVVPDCAERRRRAGLRIRFGDGVHMHGNHGRWACARCPLRHDEYAAMRLLL